MNRGTAHGAGLGQCMEPSPSFPRAETPRASRLSCAPPCPPRGPSILLHARRGLSTRGTAVRLEGRGGAESVASTLSGRMEQGHKHAAETISTLHQPRRTHAAGTWPVPVENASMQTPLLACVGGCHAPPGCRQRRRQSEGVVLSTAPTMSAVLRGGALLLCCRCCCCCSDDFVGPRSKASEPGRNGLRALPWQQAVAHLRAEHLELRRRDQVLRPRAIRSAAVPGPQDRQRHQGTCPSTPLTPRRRASLEACGHWRRAWSQGCRPLWKQNHCMSPDCMLPGSSCGPYKVQLPRPGGHPG